MSLLFAFSETDITTKFFFSSIIGVGVSAFFIFLLFWLTNQKAMFNGQKQLISKANKINQFKPEKKKNQKKNKALRENITPKKIHPNFLPTNAVSGSSLTRINS